MRSRAKVSPDSQTGPTTSAAATAATASTAETGTMPCQASYIAGRIRSFIAASSTTKRLPWVCFARITEASSTPAGPTSQRPGSSTMRTSRLCSAPRIAPASAAGSGAGSSR